MIVMEASSGEVSTSHVTLTGPSGGVQALLSRPSQDGIYPGVVIGAEAWGITTFIEDISQRLARQGYVTLTPDYLRGAGPGDEHHDDLDLIMALIDQLDFRQASED